MYSEQIFAKIGPYLKIFERKKHVEDTSFLGSYDVILFGCNRVGYDFLKLFQKLGENYLIVDFDPILVEDLKKDGVKNVQYGDAEDNEFLDEINFTQAEMIVSTIPDPETNLLLLEKLEHSKSKPICIMISYNIDNQSSN